MLTWNWGNGDNIIIKESALDIFDVNDTLFVYDNNALISDDCNEELIFGPAILDTYPPNDFSLYTSQGIDEQS